MILDVWLGFWYKCQIFDKSLPMFIQKIYGTLLHMEMSRMTFYNM